MITNSDLGRRYAAAHAAHYKDKDLRAALELYSAIADSDPDSVEAGYSRVQLQNIARSAVPRPELLAAQVELARTCLAQADPLEEAVGS